jgi:hypothetical protein
MDTWDRPCVNCSVDLPNGGSWINGKGPLCSECSINTMRLLNGGQARFDVSEIIALRAELAAAREDSERLDAAQRSGWTIGPLDAIKPRGAWTVVVLTAAPPSRHYYGQTARAAIDAARKGEATDEAD